MSIRLRQEEGRKRSSVRRCLFGKTDHENLNKALDVQEAALIQDDAKRFRERWGLDPTTGEPVDGSIFVCTKMDLTYIPSFYTKGYARKPTSSQSVQVHSRRSVKRRLVLDDQENNEVSVRPFVCTKKPNLIISSCESQPPSLLQRCTPPAPQSDVQHLDVQAKHEQTPSPQRQTVMKDYFPVQKRSSSPK